MVNHFRLLRNRNYRMYFSGQLISITGSWMQSMVQGWYVYRISGSGTWLGIINFCMQMPAFLLSLFAGSYADHKDRRKILILVQAFGMAQASLLAYLTFRNRVELWHFALLSVVLGVITAFEVTTRHAFAVDLVGKKDLPSAVSLNSILINGTRIIGPALAGILVALIGEAWCFSLNAISYIPVIYGLYVVKLASPQISRPMGNPLHRIREAIQYVNKSVEIKNLLTLSALISFLGNPFSVLLPMIAKSVLQGQAHTLGWLSAASGIGSIFGAYYGGSIDLAGLSKRRFFSRNLLGLALGIILFGLSRTLGFSLAAISVSGFFLMASFPAINNLIQQNVEDSMRARVLSLYTMSFLGATPVAGLLAGMLSDHYGPMPVLVGTGAICGALGLGLSKRRASPF